MKLTKGATMPDFTYQTAFNGEKTLYTTVAEKPTFYLFLRYFGCTICQLDIHRLKENYQRFTDKGCQVVVVLQSTPEMVQKDVQPGELPFDILCDPEQALYRQFEITPAKSMLGMASFGAIRKIQAAKKAGLTHGAYEGDELQLPALFYVGEGGTVLHAHYAKKVADLPTHEEMLALVK